MQLKHFVSAIALAGACAAHAGEPVYAGTLTSGTTFGSVIADSGPWGTPQAWSLWTFSAPWAVDVQISVAPSVSDMDPVIAVFFGTETDTANYVDMFSGSLNTTLVASADANGNGVSESLQFSNYYGNGPFVLAIADYGDGVGYGSLGYAITAQVPEPGTWALLLGGLGLLAGRARRRS